MMHRAMELTPHALDHSACPTSLRRRKNTIEAPYVTSLKLMGAVLLVRVMGVMGDEHMRTGLLQEMEWWIPLTCIYVAPSSFASLFS